ncbi:aminomethyl-transferring glycine dehydrogenase [Acidocella aminolytica]|uniref:Glycine dehydrogenase (decarboxylating) n=1 Tax=Acidocella aminolytica 101 = DSM 11237 TaxID=1120923 RepID=A0A0D6PJY0_9PROT|nr:aminomethyl-transferring glycine dehydrogenase [Acidocella aminolytica]GAN82070.1 glycine dehydrogenase [Acidocella aminolytica 101 = DSM 11237]GBQ32318.1 glycine dehydrogenase [Acidocella aminolytica 101 = DSM 11237]SHF50408.1 glycine dehydrogenase (decarboxylating) alpha subunit /glycine dehydrogenase (decarboxylating) beta subunit [Acidocella aminolytica 101 = DSM 11237]
MSALSDLAALERPDSFVARHIGPDETQIAAMLKVVGAPSLDGLIAETIPESIRTNAVLALPAAEDEAAVLARLRGLASRNVVKKSLIGLGYHGTVIPPVIQRNVLENPGWYTAYTPYQAEISQGRLEAILNFQTMIASLAGMEIANASLLDEATAAAEGVAMAFAMHKAGSKVIAIAKDVHPQTRAVIATRAWPHSWKIVDVVPGDIAGIEAVKPFALVLNYPGSTGAVRDLTAEIAAVKSAGGMAVTCADLLSLTLLTPPGEMGADIVVGSAQRFGVPMGFGGPHAGFFATKNAFKRSMPGRLVGVSVDAAGRPAMRLALQTREQHIRREKATSNICTAQVLLAVMAGFYAVWHGPEGLKAIARRVNLQARLLAELVRKAGFSLRHDTFFDMLAIEAGAKADALMQAAEAAGFNLRRIDETGIGIALDETVTRSELETLAELFDGKLAEAQLSIPKAFERQSEFCMEEVFRAHHSEHLMLRYLKRLEDKDVALNRSMIPLGSCTMKLNAAVEMAAVTWPEFADIHPFAPKHQTQGFKLLIDELAALLCEVTGFAAVSLQPNSGAQGEYAGLLTIRAFHEARGEGMRNICLIPASAHGTNPASAAMAGYKVVVVACDKLGNVDVADLHKKIEEHGERLAALMITYPSTHGVYETAIRDICQAVHAAGGQVYMDGANMNAQVGLTSPANIGADVCHLNLHKTFCIPHGGGGPGVGPIGVAAHLASHLPTHPLRPDAGPATGFGAVSAAPFGSALILPIPYAYIRLMGPEGITRATKAAILNANYISKRLEAAYPILYRGERGRVAHECIVDCRGFAANAGVQVEDIAKRLADYGFHAPTMSWPVAGTLMIEPTESEDKGELDRFCDAMLSIAGEIALIASGTWSKDDNPLKNAPHIAAEVMAEEWTHAYSRQVAAFPLSYVAAQKYWPPVKRVDNVYGDRNLVCSCAPLDAYLEDVA